MMEQENFVYIFITAYITVCILTFIFFIGIIIAMLIHVWKEKE
jgi:hypothetical protein